NVLADWLESTKSEPVELIYFDAPVLVLKRRAIRFIEHLFHYGARIEIADAQREHLLGKVQRKKFCNENLIDSLGTNSQSSQIVEFNCLGNQLAHMLGRLKENSLRAVSSSTASQFCNDRFFLSDVCFPTDRYSIDKLHCTPIKLQCWKQFFE